MNSQEPVARDHGSDTGPVPWCRDSGDRGRVFLNSLGGVARHAHEPAWGGGNLSLTLVQTDQRPPDDLVVSTRCVVTDGGEALVCQTPNGPHKAAELDLTPIDQALLRAIAR